MLKNVLLVDDNEDEFILMGEAFKASRPDVVIHCVNHSDDAMQFLRHEGRFKASPRPDLVLLDLNLPGKTGLEMLEEIRADARLADIAVIILTGSHSPEDRDACTKLRCRYAVKPPSFSELTEFVNSL